MTAFDAMTLGTAGYTAAQAIMLMEHNGLKPENGPVAVTGATGGVGSVAIEILAKIGYHVVAITGKPEEARYLRGIGAKEVLLRQAIDLSKIRPLDKSTWAGAIDNLGGDMLAWLLSTSKIGGTVAAVGLAAGMKLNTTVTPFILRGVALLGIDSANTPMSLRQRIWNKLAVEWRPDRVHDQVRTIDFDELPTHFDPYLEGHGPRAHGRADRAGSRQRYASMTAGRWRSVQGAVHRRVARRPRSASGASEAALVDWQTPFTSVLDYSQPPFAQVVRRRPHQPLPQRRRSPSRARAASRRRSIYLSTETGATKRYTYRELAAEVNRCAAMLQGAGRRARRSRADLHADDRRSGVRDARLRAHRRDPFGRVRRIRGGEPRHADRRRRRRS